MANVRIYSRRLHGSLRLSPNFTVSEFASNDGADRIEIDLDLIPLLQRFRDYVQGPVSLNSAYRTASWNAQVGGSSSSYHLYGRAVDIGFRSTYRNLTSISLMANFFNTIGVKGIIFYNSYIHVDTRTTKYHATIGGTILNLGTVNIPFRGLLRIGSTGTDVGIMQFKLASLGYNPGHADMIFGNGTEAAVRRFQTANGLTADGLVGPMTWSRLF